MEILDVGIPELIVIFVIIMLVMGPEDVQKTARTLGRLVRTVRSSDIWQGIVQVSRELRWQFTHLSQEAGLNESLWKNSYGHRVEIEEDIRQRLFASANNEQQGQSFPETQISLSENTETSKGENSQATAETSRISLSPLNKGK